MVRKPCCDKEGLKKGPWTSGEDQKLIDYIQGHGPGNWRTLPKKAGLQRCGKSCRLRWTNYLRPDIKRGRFSFEEEETIIQLHSIMGNKWSAIAAKLPGRTDNEIKNYFNTHIRKRLLRMGIDPVTHGPRLDYLDFPSILSTLQNSPLLNFPTALLNLQNLLNNQELLKLATSFSSSSHNEIIPNFITQNPILSNNTLVNNPYDVVNAQIANKVQPFTQNFQSLNGLLSSSTDTNNSGFLSNNSNQSSSAVYPLDSGYRYLDNNMGHEDEIVNSYFMISNVDNQLES